MHIKYNANKKLCFFFSEQLLFYHKVKSLQRTLICTCIKYFLLQNYRIHKATHKPQILKFLIGPDIVATVILLKVFCFFVRCLFKLRLMETGQQKKCCFVSQTTLKIWMNFAKSYSFMHRKAVKVGYCKPAMPVKRWSVNICLQVKHNSPSIKTPFWTISETLKLHHILTMLNYTD